MNFINYILIMVDILVKYDNSINDKFNNKQIRITPNNLICVYDFIQVYYLVKHAKKKIDIFKKNNNKLFEFTEDFQFSGKGQIKQYICNIDRINQIITTFPKYSDEINKKFIKYIKDNFSKIIDIPIEFINLNIEEIDNNYQLSSLLNELVPECKEQKIRMTPDKMVSVYDIIKIFSNINKPRNIWYDISKKKNISNNISIILNTITYYKFNGQGQRETPVIHIDYIDELLKIIIPNIKMPIERKQKILKCDVVIKQYTEIEIHNNIIKAFNNLKYKTQYQVDKYYIDLYFIENNVAIECDEYGHIGYNKEKDKERTDYINNKLNCKWIRYDPYDNNFNIFELINRIFKTIIK